jgi:hypothetical protein
MNDHDAMTAINEVMDRYLGHDGLDAFAALFEIAKICGTNKQDHEAAK